MPIHHTVIITFTRNLTAEESSELLEAAHAMKARIPAILDIKCGLDLGLSGSAGIMFSLLATFADIHAYEEYRTHPVHVKFIENHIKPVLVDRKAVQFETRM